MEAILFYPFILMAFYALFRLAFFSASSLVQDIKKATQKKKTSYYRPHFTVIIPAFNEESTIAATIDSIQQQDYPPSRLKIIVANDGSIDNTAKIVRSYTHRKLKFKVRLITRPNRGKAKALNYAMKQIKGGLIMCLDADSKVAENCIKNMAQHFRDRKVMGAAANVNIEGNRTILATAQRIEYLISHFLKRSYSLLGMEYIIGGIGSVFRQEILKKINYYDTNTMTEDIDLTMKIVQLGKKYKLVFAEDAVTITRPAQTFSDLLKQRFRWKYGRLQTFLKNRRLFMNVDKKYNKLLTVYLLPVTLIYECMNLFEPLLLAFTLFLLLKYGDASAFLVTGCVYGVVYLLSVWTADYMLTRDKVKLSIFAPFAYLYMYVITACDFIVGVKSFLKLPKIKSSLQNRHVTWVSPKR